MMMVYQETMKQPYKRILIQAMIHDSKDRVGRQVLDEFIVGINGTVLLVGRGSGWLAIIVLVS